MPFFVWNGIDLAGNDREGCQMARNAKDLNVLLFQQDIALLNYRLHSLHEGRAISLKEKSMLFHQLALLLEAGIYLNSALEVISMKQKGKKFKKILIDISKNIEHGYSFHEALHYYPQVFDPLTLQLIIAGQESGNIAYALKGLHVYLEDLIEFRKKIHNALLMPLIILMFFFIISLIIFVVVIPTFISMFAMIGQPIGKITQYLVTISSYLRSWIFPLMTIVMVSMGFVIYKGIRKSLLFHTIADTLMWHLPGIKPIVRSVTLYFFFKSFALLIESGVPFKMAITTINQTSNTLFSGKIDSVYTYILQGHSLSAALSKLSLVPENIIAMVQVGEESNKLPFMLCEISSFYRDWINNYLSKVATIVQPVLMIVLGVVIMLLIFAVYLPVFNIGYAIT